MNLRLLHTNNSYNKLTLTATEARLKFKKEESISNQEKVIKLANIAKNTIDKNLLTKTLRGNFIFDEGTVYIELRYGRKTGKCVAYFCN